MGTTGALYGYTMKTGMIDKMKAYAQSAGYAEQALYAIKVVHTYNQESLEHKNYSNHLITALKKGNKSNLFKHVSYALFYSGIFFFYAYAFYWAGYLKWNEVRDFNGEIFTGGKCITVIFCMLFGTMGLSASLPHVSALAEGKIAGTLAYSVIDEKPKINVDEAGTKVLQRDEVKGEIVF